MPKIIFDIQSLSSRFYPFMTTKSKTPASRFTSIYGVSYLFSILTKRTATISTTLAKEYQ
jgi:hypothetical protein